VLTTIEIFARKIIRLWGDLTEDDVNNEMRAVDKLCRTNDTHPNIVTVFDYGRISQFIYFIDMELCDLNLERWIYRSWDENAAKKMPFLTTELPSRARVGQVWDIMEDITCAVAFIHSKLEIHRDLKPANSVYLCVNEAHQLVLCSLGDQAWKVTDFAFTMEGSSRREHTTLYSRGTRSYRAPELVRLDQKSKYTNKVDIWAVGCILYELVLKRRAFADDWEVLQHVKSGKEYEVIIGPASVPDERRRGFLAKIIKELLNSDPSGRPSAQTLYERFISWGSDNVLKKAAFKVPTERQLSDVGGEVGAARLTSLPPVQSSSADWESYVQDPFSATLVVRSEIDTRKGPSKNEGLGHTGQRVDAATRTAEAYRENGNSDETIMSVALHLIDQPRTRELISWDVNAQKTLIVMHLGRKIYEKARGEAVDPPPYWLSWYELWDLQMGRMIWRTSAIRRDPSLDMPPKFAPDGDSLVFHSDDKLHILGSLSKPDRIGISGVVDLFVNLFATYDASNAKEFAISPDFSRIAFRIHRTFKARSSPAAITQIPLQFDEIGLVYQGHTQLQYSEDGRMLHHIFIHTHQVEGGKMTGANLWSYSVQLSSLVLTSAKLIPYDNLIHSVEVHMTKWAWPVGFDEPCLLIWLKGKRYPVGNYSCFSSSRKVFLFIAAVPSDAEGRTTNVARAPGVVNPVVTKPYVHLLSDGRFVDIDAAAILQWPCNWGQKDPVFRYPEGGWPRLRSGTGVWTRERLEAVAVTKGRLYMVSPQGQLSWYTCHGVDTMEDFG
jgi:serine/threonine protein kinase